MAITKNSTENTPSLGMGKIDLQTRLINPWDWEPNDYRFSLYLINYGYEILLQSAFRLAQKHEEALAGQDEWSDKHKVALAWFNVWQILAGGERDKLDKSRRVAIECGKKMREIQQRYEEVLCQVNDLFTELQKIIEQVRDHFVFARYFFRSPMLFDCLMLEGFQPPIQKSPQECKEMVRLVWEKLKELKRLAHWQPSFGSGYWVKPTRRIQFAIEVKEIFTPLLDKIEEVLNQYDDVEGNLRDVNSRFEQCCQEIDGWWNHASLEFDRPFAAFDLIEKEISGQYDKDQLDQMRGHDWWGAIMR